MTSYIGNKLLLIVSYQIGSNRSLMTSEYRFVLSKSSINRCKALYKKKKKKREKKKKGKKEPCYILSWIQGFPTKSLTSRQWNSRRGFRYFSLWEQNQTKQSKMNPMICFPITKRKKKRETSSQKEVGKPWYNRCRLLFFINTTQLLVTLGKLPSIPSLHPPSSPASQGEANKKA